MRKFSYPPETDRGDSRCGNELIETFVAHIGTIAGAAKHCGLTPSHLRVWLHDPDRGMNPENSLKMAKGMRIPVEAVIYRWTPVKDLNMWNWVK